MGNNALPKCVPPCSQAKATHIAVNLRTPLARVQPAAITRQDAEGRREWRSGKFPLLSGGRGRSGKFPLLSGGRVGKVPPAFGRSRAVGKVPPAFGRSGRESSPCFRTVGSGKFPLLSGCFRGTLHLRGASQPPSPCRVGKVPPAFGAHSTCEGPASRPHPAGRGGKAGMAVGKVPPALPPLPPSAFRSFGSTLPVLQLDMACRQIQPTRPENASGRTHRPW
jgi:hypothetical protein